MADVPSVGGGGNPPATTPTTPEWDFDRIRGYAAVMLDECTSTDYRAFYQAVIAMADSFEDMLDPVDMDEVRKAIARLNAERGGS